MSMQEIIDSLTGGKVIKKGEYAYLLHPLFDGFPNVESTLFHKVIDQLSKAICSFDEFDKLVTIEAMGVPFAAGVCLQTSIPFSIIRKRRYHLEKELVVHQKTGYSSSELSLNGFHHGERVVIIDDVLSSGGTLSAVIEGLQSLGVEVIGVCVVIDKGRKRIDLEKRYSVPIIPLLTLKVSMKGIEMVNVWDNS